MKKILFCNTFFGVAASIITACSLESIPNKGQECDNVVFYSDGANNRKYYHAWENDYKKIYEQYKSCPAEYPICSTLKEEGNTIHFCHEECRSNEIFCSTMCINPNESPKFCGAKGNCSSTQDDSNSMGYDCHQLGAIACENGKCICLNGQSFKDGSCQSDTKASCGASKTICNTDQTCENGQCIDSASCSAPKLNCERCVDPQNDHEYCGSDSCSSPIKCATHQNCRNGKCECIPGFEMNASNDKCIKICSANEHRYEDDCELDSDEHCGEHGKQCNGNQFCQTKQCVQDNIEQPVYEEPVPELPPTIRCTEDSDCKSNEKCQNGDCIESASETDVVKPNQCGDNNYFDENLKECCHKGDLDIHSSNDDSCKEDCSYSDDSLACVFGSISIQPNMKEVSLKNLKNVTGYIKTMTTSTSSWRNNLTSIHLNNLQNVDKYIEISSSNISTLDMPSLRHVGMNLFIFGNNELTTINLPNLESVEGEFKISYNDLIKSITLGISNISKGLYIEENKNLQSISLEHLHVTSSITISNNQSLSKIKISDSINGLNKIMISHNPDLSCITLCDLELLKSLDASKLNIEFDSNSNINLDSCEYPDKTNDNYPTFGDLCSYKSF